MDLIKEGMNYHAKANAVFGRLLARYQEVEAKEDTARQENIVLKSALARERSQHGDVLHTNASLQKELDQIKEYLKTSDNELKSNKEELKATKISERKLADMNVGFVEENEALKANNEELVTANQNLVKQVHDLQVKAREDKERHSAKRRKLRHKLKALEERGPPLTEELRKHIQTEYRASDELNVEILRVYSEGYEVCRSRGKEKLIAAKIDPALLNSEDEDNA